MNDQLSGHAKLAPAREYRIKTLPDPGALDKPHLSLPLREDHSPHMTVV
jgi:hypothetical protein